MSAAVRYTMRADSEEPLMPGVLVHDAVGGRLAPGAIAPVGMVAGELRQSG